MLIIIQNDPEVPLGSYADFLADMHVPYRTLHPYAGESLPAPECPDAIILLGGAMGVHDTDRHPFLHDVKGFILAAVERQVPLLGICLGGQLLAHVLGAEVVSGSPFGEKGTLPVRLTDAGKVDPLFTGIGPEFASFQWHNDSFATPAGGVHLAFSAACPNQAFRYGANAYGTQFHPELNREIVAEWCSWTSKTAAMTHEFLTAFDVHATGYRNASHLLLANFLRIARLI